MTEQPNSTLELAQLFAAQESQQDDAPAAQDSDHSAPPAGDNAVNPDAQPLQDAEGIDTEGEALPEGDDDASEVADVEEAKPESNDQKHKVTIDGETFEVGTDELRNGYMRQEAFSRKTAEHAEKVRTFEAETWSIKQQQLQVLEGLQQRFQQLDPIGLLRNEYQRALNGGDTETALLVKDKIEELRLEQYRINQALAQENEQKEQQSKAKTEEYIGEQHKALFEKMPFLKDEKRLNTFKESIAKSLEKVGYGVEDFAEFDKKPDHRHAMLAYYAGLYFKSLDSRPQVAQSLKGKIVSPSATARGGTDKKQSALSNFDKNPRDLHALAAVLSL